MEWIVYLLGFIQDWQRLESLRCRCSMPWPSTMTGQLHVMHCRRNG